MPASVFAVLCIDGKGKKRKSGKVVHRSAASDDLARTNVKILQDIFRQDTGSKPNDEPLHAESEAIRQLTEQETDAAFAQEAGGFNPRLLDVFIRSKTRTFPFYWKQ